MTARSVALGLLAALCFIGAAQAKTINLNPDGQWHPFDVDDFSSQSGGLEWISLDGTALNFSISLAGPALLTIVDGGFAGDIFRVFDNGISLGLTSNATNTFPITLGVNFDAALADARWSNGSFLLDAGLHSISGLLAVSALDNSMTAINATVGALKLVSIAEPSTAFMFLIGCGLLAVVIGRRSGQRVEVRQ